ncbi:MAG: hypothetical protein K0R92_2326 [Lachnospiraceae bacterium]|jgi:hypothetical protein|nr:hypothetical protein [Lachnospiraceae bacterium]
MNIYTAVFIEQQNLAFDPQIILLHYYFKTTRGVGAIHITIAHNAPLYQ